MSVANLPLDLKIVNVRKGMLKVAVLFLENGYRYTLNFLFYSNVLIILGWQT